MPPRAGGGRRGAAGLPGRPQRRATAEAVVVEIWNWFEDVGGALRGLDGKVAALRDHLDPSVEWTLRGLFIVRDTRRNRQLVTELGPIFAARFPGNAGAWLRALTDPAERLPDGDGLLGPPPAAQRHHS